MKHFSQTILAVVFALLFGTMVEHASGGQPQAPNPAEAGRLTIVVKITDSDGTPFADLPLAVGISGPMPGQERGVTNAQGELTVTLYGSRNGRHRWRVAVSKFGQQLTPAQVAAADRWEAERESMLALATGVETLPRSGPILVDVSVRNRAVATGRIELVTATGTRLLSRTEVGFLTIGLETPLMKNNADGTVKLVGLGAAPVVDVVVTYGPQLKLLRLNTSSGTADWGSLQFLETPADAGTLVLRATNPPPSKIRVHGPGSGRRVTLEQD